MEGINFRGILTAQAFMLIISLVRMGKQYVCDSPNDLLSLTQSIAAEVEERSQRRRIEDL